MNDRSKRRCSIRHGSEHSENRTGVECTAGPAMNATEKHRSRPGPCADATSTPFLGYREDVPGHLTSWLRPPSSSSLLVELHRVLALFWPGLRGSRPGPVSYRHRHSRRQGHRTQCQPETEQRDAGDEEPRPTRPTKPNKRSCSISSDSFKKARACDSRPRMCTRRTISRDASRRNHDERVKIVDYRRIMAQQKTNGSGQKIRRPNESRSARLSECRLYTFRVKYKDRLGKTC